MLVVLVLGLGFDCASETLAAPELVASRIQSTLQKRGVPLGSGRLFQRVLRLLKSLVTISPVFLVFFTFSLAFDRARKVASEDAGRRFRAAHVGVRTSLKLLEDAPRDKLVPGLNAIIKTINTGSAHGRAIPSGRDCRHIVVLVGTETPDLDYPYKRDADDHVYVIDKKAHRCGGPMVKVRYSMQQCSALL